MSFRLLLSETEHRPYCRLGIDLSRLARRCLLGVRSVRLLGRRNFGTCRGRQRKACGKGDRQAVMGNQHPAILGEAASSRLEPENGSCARNGAAMEGVIAANLAAVRSRIEVAAWS